MVEHYLRKGTWTRALPPALSAEQYNALDFSTSIDLLTCQLSAEQYTILFDVARLQALALASLLASCLLSNTQFYLTSLHFKH
ncbi:hypothetical protein J6590_078872 [Homalodisca vitripennis]|nr:hypothetical protein J6590_078872 [Homalodisca vitripennis]